MVRSAAEPLSPSVISASQMPTAAKNVVSEILRPVRTPKMRNARVDKTDVQ